MMVFKMVQSGISGMTGILGMSGFPGMIGPSVISEILRMFGVRCYVWNSWNDGSPGKSVSPVGNYWYSWYVCNFWNDLYSRYFWNSLHDC